MRRALPLSILLLTALFAACQGPQTVDGMFKSARKHLLEDSGLPSRKTEDTMIEYRARVHVLYEAGAIEGPEESLQACFLLSSSREIDDLELAYALALQAVELGDLRGLPMSADALDRGCVVKGTPQHYGTQFIWEPVLQRWRQHPVDPTTTDEEREQFGIPPLAELQLWLDELNAPYEAAEHPSWSKSDREAAQR